ncbi:hypothetical protein L1049_016117 [Liquidambar formosana]|uniref:RPW8 domain-containing protein n=1 Tax=Liquidambar formosana TaxID=63359 RepID=A0AAP0X099_LIQFO
MALEAVLGAVVGTLFLKLIGIAVYAAKKVSDFESAFKILESTLNSLTLKMSEIKLDNIGKLIELREKGKKLINKCTKVARWEFHKKIEYSCKLRGMDDSICEFIWVNLQVEQLKEVKGKTLKMKALKKKPETIRVEDRNGTCRDFNENLAGVFQWIRGKKPNLKIRFIATAAWLAFEVY